jgi:hypothetical protein
MEGKAERVVRSAHHSAGQGRIAIRDVTLGSDVIRTRASSAITLSASTSSGLMARSRRSGRSAAITDRAR